MLQPEPAATVPQLFVCAKLLAFAPVMDTPLTSSGALPVFDTNTICIPLVMLIVCALNVSALGERVAAGAPEVCPSRQHCCLRRSRSIVRYADGRTVRRCISGVNVTWIVQPPDAASDPPQLFVCVKLLALAPPTVMPVMVNAPVPVFDSVIVLAGLVVPTVWLLKATVAGARLALGVSGAVPVPVKAAVCGDPVALSATLNVAESGPATVGVNVT